jgi:putative FmdB family regulatory protein
VIKIVNYDYVCSDCKTVFETEHGMNETPVVKCSICGSEKTKKYYGSYVPPAVFKGTGFTKGLSEGQERGQQYLSEFRKKYK